jgi:uncharacterized OB-fold protein
MKWKMRLIALAFGATATALLAQETTTTKQESTTTKTTSASGSVVKYTPGQMIVIRSSDGKETTYTIASSADVPAEVQIGKTVTISTEPASDGSGPAVVTRIQTTSVDSSGQTKTTTEKTEASPSGTTKTTTTTVAGTVTAFEPGQSITVEQPDHQTVTFTIDTQSQLPKDVSVGKTVTITTRTVSGSSSPVVRTVTYRTVTKKSSSSTNPQ